jgi:peptidoglycan-associated lipoprotein
MLRTDIGFLERAVELVRTTGLALMLVAVPTLALAGDDALVELYLGPHQTDGVALKQLVVRLDGKELALPDPGGAPERPVIEVPISSGPHGVDVEIQLDGHSGFFSYLDEYRFKLRGHLDVAARSGEVAAVKVAVLRTSGFMVPWESRYRLSLSATSYPSDRVAAATAPASTPSPTPVMASVTAEAPQAATPVACALDPVLFPFDRTTLTATSMEALDRFAACLGRTTRAVRLEGHCDVRGSAAYNQQLGERRADAVVKYLRKKGLAAVRLSKLSWGKSKPLCEETTEACHARNRRVEAILGD